MMCTLDHIRECLKPIKPKELNIPTGIVFPRDQSIKIDAGPLLGLVTRQELRSHLYDHINQTLAYYNFLYLLTGPIINKDYGLSYKSAFSTYKFSGDVYYPHEQFLDPKMYPTTYNQNLKPVDPLAQSNGIQNIPEYKTAFEKCMAVFVKCDYKIDDVNVINQEVAKDLDFSAKLYSQSFYTTRTARGRARKLRKKKTMKRKH